jgi:histidyl-tRNA synthetase
MFQHLKGFRDFYPEDCAVRNRLFFIMWQCARSFNFTEYDAPILEPLELFTKKSGEEIANQLFNFEDRGGRSVALRPEVTPSLIRMVGAKIHSLPKPIQWYSIGECFRYERPQKGRLRSFYQFNADILGEESPNADAEVIALGIHILQSLRLGPEDFHVRLSDRQLWTLFLKSQGIAESDLEDALKCIDQSEKKGTDALQESLSQLPSVQSKQIPLGKLLMNIGEFKALSTTNAISKFFDRQPFDRSEDRCVLQQRLASMEQLLFRLQTMGYGDYITLDLSIVRGLAYYTGFVFEFFEREGRMRALAGGGRYDDLATKLGCSKTNIPAVGLAMGDVTLRQLLEDKGKLSDAQAYIYPWRADIALLFDSPKAKAWALEDATQLRQKGYVVTYNLSEKQMPITKQLEQIKAQNTAHYIGIYGENPDQVEIYDVDNNTRCSIPREKFRNIDFHSSSQDPLAPFRLPKTIESIQDDSLALP